MTEITTVEKYAQSEVVACWQNLSRQGLQASEQAMVARYLPGVPDAFLLDAGCGAGRAGLALVRAGYRVVGVDLSLPMLLAGRALSTEARLNGADILALPFADHTFAAVLMFFGALQHIPGRDRRRQALAELARVTQPYGRLIVGLDNLAPALVCYVYWLGRKLWSVFGQPVAGSVVSTAADATLWSRENRRARPLFWHARGLGRSLRWRSWAGLIDLTRHIAPGDRAEPGDAWVAQFSLDVTPGRIYYHVYGADEFIRDAASAGWSLMGYHSGAELNEGQLYPPPVRQRDKQLFFALEKMKIRPSA